MKPNTPSLESLALYYKENGRIYPRPNHWQALYDLLPGSRRIDAGWGPTLPRILAAWLDTPHLAKIRRVREHLERADKHGALDTVGAYLHAFPEDQWLHHDD